MAVKEIKKHKLKRPPIKTIKKNIEIKIDPKTGKAHGFLFNKPKIVITNSPKIKAGQSFMGRVSNIKKKTNNPVATPGKKITGKLKKN
jgi:hypothetical protein